VRGGGPVRSFVVARSQRRRGHRSGQGRPDRGGPTITRDRDGRAVEGTSGAAVGSGFREHGLAAALRRIGSRFRAGSWCAGRPRPSSKWQRKLLLEGSGSASSQEGAIHRTEGEAGFFRARSATGKRQEVSGFDPGWGKSVMTLSGVVAGVVRNCRSRSTPELGEFGWWPSQGGRHPSRSGFTRSALDGVCGLLVVSLVPYNCRS
jgi:hypothetical protein